MSVITNEVALIKDCINNKTYPEDIGLKRFINMIIGYIYKYTETEKDPNVFQSEVLSILRDIDTLTEPYYQEYKYAGYVKKQADKLIKGKMEVDLKEIKSVDITESEINIIKSANTEAERKVLFTLYVLAKINTSVTGWINYSNKIIFELANVRCTNKEKIDCLRSLHDQGLIQINMIIDKHGYKVNLGTDIDKVEMTIDNFEDLGKQYLNKYKDGWQMCECCHRMFKVQTNIGRTRKYCNRCDKEMNKKNTRIRMENLRNTTLFV